MFLSWSLEYEFDSESRSLEYNKKKGLKWDLTSWGLFIESKPKLVLRCALDLTFLGIGELGKLGSSNEIGLDVMVVLDGFTVMLLWHILYSKGVRECSSVMGLRSKPVTIEHKMSHRGQLIKYGSFDLLDLARFVELMEKNIGGPVKHSSKTRVTRERRGIEKLGVLAIEVAHIRAQGEKTYGAFFSWRRRLPVVDSTTI
ncbi:hypothetical protein PVK06_042616 [Gossypium arboreum]|uniref:Uncharacterized protein n=1 Tax=Gossypium arboreum TaxID=29729 RepID=A0ABR0MLG6_GOSAR|nr:hypothetical protein PVK06_042616 [Gossypium arboreum]